MTKIQKYFKKLIELKEQNKGSESDCHLEIAILESASYVRDVEELELMRSKRY